MCQIAQTKALYLQIYTDFNPWYFQTIKSDRIAPYYELCHLHYKNCIVIFRVRVGCTMSVDGYWPDWSWRCNWSVSQAMMKWPFTVYNYWHNNIIPWGRMKERFTSFRAHLIQQFDHPFTLFLSPHFDGRTSTNFLILFLYFRSSSSCNPGSHFTVIH